MIQFYHMQMKHVHIFTWHVLTNIDYRSTRTTTTSSCANVTAPTTNWFISITVNYLVDIWAIHSHPKCHSSNNNF